MGRGDVSDEDWAIIEPFLPSERGRGCRPAHDNRRFFNGMMFALRTGIPWRDLPETYGNWNSVFRRFRRWCEQGVFDALLETLVELGSTDDWQDQMFDSTSVRGHSQAAGARGGTRKEGFGRSRGGFTSKIHARCNRLGRMIAFRVTGGEASDSKQLIPLMADPVSVPTAKNALGDAGYDSDANRDELLFHGIRPVIKPNPTRKNIPSFDETCYKTRNQVERMFNKIKQMRRLATRYDKTLSSFRGFICLVAIKLWLPVFVHSP